MLFLRRVPPNCFCAKFIPLLRSSFRQEFSSYSSLFHLVHSLCHGSPFLQPKSQLNLANAFPWASLFLCWNRGVDIICTLAVSSWWTAEGSCAFSSTSPRGKCREPHSEGNERRKIFAWLAPNTWNVSVGGRWAEQKKNSLFWELKHLKKICAPISEEKKTHGTTTFIN